MSTPQTAQEKIEAIHDLAADDQVAARVATDLLRRPEVAFHAAHDDQARELFYRARIEADQWTDDESADVPGSPLEDSPIAPALRAMDKTLLFLDWKKACHQLLVATHDLVPALQDEDLGEDVAAVIEQGLARLRAACDWVAHALATGEIDMDEELARLLHDNDGSGAGEGDGEEGDDGEDDDGGAGVPA
ncbi:DUF6192 family protein [Streptomyces sp. NPDC050315]|uniref:DUF6192 family protein n=1 Tax=Streptomyces sp. NPDC050315 TaxID=3155039 RepID=UPI0034483FB0